jgi:hypothetical protein
MVPAHPLGFVHESVRLGNLGSPFFGRYPILLASRSSVVRCPVHGRRSSKATSPQLKIEADHNRAKHPDDDDKSKELYRTAAMKIRSSLASA